VPPVYFIRFARSFFALTLIALPIAAIVSTIVFKRPARRKQRFTAAAIIIFLCIAAGSAVAATDAFNRGAWNPVFYGGGFVAASLPAALAAGTSRDDAYRRSILVLGLISALPIALLIIGVGPTLMLWIARQGLPVTW
jgi:hypothetical protein